MNIFERVESEVRSYCRTFPVVFDRASGPYLYDESGRGYIDFFCGAGGLNYGHNDPPMKRALIEYLERDGVVHSLDMYTRAKATFLARFDEIILKPRGLSYRVQFTGPTGTNAIEAALKLARKVTGRRNIVAFTKAYHGLSLGSLAATANSSYRNEAFIDRNNVSFVPFDGYFGPGVDTLAQLTRLLEDDCSGIDRPAAVLVETIQAEGGINVASVEWLRGLEALCGRLGILLIVDDIQTGCGRTGTFFSFEAAGLKPDMIVLSKSISGFGLPMSLLLIRPALDQWKRAEHTGTFRGNNAAFVTGAEALRYWQSDAFADGLRRSSRIVQESLADLQRKLPALGIQFRGRGMLFGVETASADINRATAQECFARGLIVETCGADRNVLKLMPALNIPEPVLREGLEILGASLQAAAAGALSAALA